jgi:hypothetical protein
LVSGDVGHTVRVVVTASNAGGSTPASSAASAVVLAETKHSFRTFYVDYEGGSESNSGESTGAAWKRAPGMQGFTHSYTHKAGDHFIFKGGVTWPKGVFPFVIAHSGEAGNEDYYGVNESWYAGSRYEAPVFNAEGSRITNEYEGKKLDDMLWMRATNYVTVEGVALKNWTAKEVGHPGWYCDAIDVYHEGGSDDENLRFNKISVTNWSSDWESTEGSEGHFCKVFQTNPNYAANISLTHSTIEGKEGEAIGWEVGCISRIEDDVIGKATGLVEPCPNTSGVSVVADNVLYDCGYPKWPQGATHPMHGDAMQSRNSVSAETDYIYGNVEYNTGYTGEGIQGVSSAEAQAKGWQEGECESALLGGEEGQSKSVTVYMWNNVFYRIGGNAPQVDAETNSWYSWNNTFEGGELGSEGCLQGPAHNSKPAVLEWKNNLCVGSEGGTDEGASSTLIAAATSAHVADNLVVGSNAEARSDHYASPGEVEEGKAAHVYEPRSEAELGHERGEDLSSLCSGHLASLCEDTAYAAARTPNARPSAGRWDVGAYQW